MSTKKKAAATTSSAEETTSTKATTPTKATKPERVKSAGDLEREKLDQYAHDIGEIGRQSKLL